MRFLCLIMIFHLVCVSGFSQQWAGPDKERCEYGDAVQIGSNDPCVDCCYSWSNPELLSCSTCKNPMVIELPDNTTFSVEVRDKNLKLIGTDEVAVTLTFGDIHFTPNYLTQSSNDTVEAELLLLSDEIDLDEIYWDFEGMDLGCMMDVKEEGFKAWITPGDEYGQVTIRADYNGSNIPGECYALADIDINNGVKDVIAVDLTHDDRTARTGDTLYVVGHGDVQIIAIPNEGGFKDGVPDWKPDSHGSATPENNVAIHTMTESPTIFGRESDYQAGEGPDFMPKVKVIRYLPNVVENEVAIPGFESFVDKIKNAVKFKDNGLVEPDCGSFAPLSVNISAPTFRYKTSIVEKYKNPHWGLKEEYVIDAGIGLSGKIYHPVFTKHAYIPLIDIYVCTQLFAGADASLTVSINTSADPSQENPNWKVDNIQAELAFVLSGNIVLNVESDDYAAVASAVFSTSVKPKILYDVASSSLIGKVEIAPATVKVVAKIKNISNPADVRDVFKFPSVEVQLIPAIETPPHTIKTF